MAINDELPMLPDPDEPPAAEEAGDAGYRGAEQRCANCAHFAEPNVCKKGVNGGTVDPEGSSNHFELTGEGYEDEEVM